MQVKLFYFLGIERWLDCADARAGLHYCSENATNQIFHDTTYLMLITHALQVCNSMTFTKYETHA